MLSEFEKRPLMVVLILVGVVGILFTTLILFYTDSNENIRASLLDREVEHQESRAANFVMEIGENYEILVLHTNKFLPNDLSNGVSEQNIEILKNSISEEVSKIERITIADKNHILYQSEVDKEFNFENAHYVEEVISTKKSTLSKGFSGDDGQYYFAQINPIINNNNEFEGYVEIIYSANGFFNKLTYHLSSVEQHLTVIDRDGFILFSIQSNDIGTHVFDDVVLEKFDFDQNMIKKKKKVILGGQTLSYPYPTEFGLFLATGTPVMINGEQIFTIYLTVPVSTIVTLPQTIFDDVQNITLVIISLVAGIIGLLFFVIAKMSNKEHKLRVDNMEKDLMIARQDKLTTIGELTARIAHDLRNPLSTLKNSTELVQHYDTKPEVVSLTKKMQRAIDRMSHQIEDVLGYLKKPEPNYSIISMNDLLNEVRQSLIIPDYIQIRFPKEDVQIEGDIVQLQTVFSNLILNSIQAIGEQSGLIMIGISEDDENAIVEIMDSGPGIPNERKEKVFEPLFTTKQRGTGLGLPSVRNIVQAHDGDVFVKSCKPAVFDVVLPKSLDKGMNKKENLVLNQ